MLDHLVIIQRYDPELQEKFILPHLSANKKVLNNYYAVKIYRFISIYRQLTETL